MEAFSIFTGAGGLDLGLERAGFRAAFAVENDPVAVATLNLNRRRFFPHLEEVEPLDITELDAGQTTRRLGLSKGDIALLAGGPPCVAFSKSGFHLEYKRAGRDARANLVYEYLRFLDGLGPAAFLMENVFGLAYRNQSRSVFRKFLGELRRIGYSVNHAVLNAADYGVPQNRQRLFVIGARDGRPLSFPRPTHWGEHERRRPPPDVGVRRPHVTCAQAFKDLIAAPEPGEEVAGKYGHLLPGIPPGSNYLHYTSERGHRAPLFRWRSRYWTFLLKLHPDRPAPTIQGQPGPYVGPFHWENRRLRVPELTRLQTFPDDYLFAGNRRAIQLQIGNAVPPSLAALIADAIRRQLAGEVGDEATQLSLSIA